MKEHRRTKERNWERNKESPNWTKKQTEREREQ